MRRNITANIVGRAWGVTSVYIFVPLYLRFLGIEAYGMVGFYSTLLAVLAFADMGFTASLNREMARLSASTGSLAEMRNLLRTYEVTYLCISSAVAGIAWCLAPAIADHWLRAERLPHREIRAAVRLMGVAIAFQLPSGLYVGGLMGLQQQVRANCLQIAWGVLRGTGAILVLWLFSPTIVAFALWQSISNALYAFFARLSLWHALAVSSAQSHPPFSWEPLRGTWRYAAGMLGMSLVSTLLTQTDKVTVSKMLPLQMLGYYSLAGAVASAPLMLAGPIALAVFPRLTGLVATGDRIGLAQLYHKTCQLVSVAVIPAGLTIALFAGELIAGWTGSAITAQRAGLVTSFLVGGQLMQAITVIPFYIALAHGDVRLNLKIGIISVLLITPLLICLIMRFGVLGGGISWLAMNLCTLPPYMYFLHRRFLPGELRRWCLRSVGRPLLAALPAILLARVFLPMPSSRLLAVGLIGIVWSLSAVAAASTMPEWRTGFIENVGKRLGLSYGV